MVDPDFDEFYRTHRIMAVELAWLLTHDRSTAEDVAQDAFMAVLRGGSEIANPVSYLRRSVVNGVYQRGRHRSRERRRNQLVTAGEPTSMAGPTGGLADLIADLPLDQRTAVVLRYWSDLRHDEIAAAMGIRPGTARSHLSRATTRLRKDLQ